MDIPPPPPLPPSPPPTTTTGNGGFSEVEPPNVVQPNRSGKHPAPPSTNVVHNRYHPLPLIGFAYGKCNKNYAASAGGQVHDGCGEFMPSLTSAPTEPTFLFCDACGCHRSFHRQTENYYPPYHHVIEYPQTSPPSAMSPSSSSPSPISTSYFPTAPHMYHAVNQSLHPHHANYDVKKRVRTKFTAEQKEKMQEFAERIGWKMLKKEEEVIQGFCKDVGVTKGVFKVWMHNHKNQNAKNNNHPAGEKSHTS